MAYVTSNCPRIKREAQTLYQFAVVGNENKPFPFERKVCWLQESESRVEYVHGGKVLHRGPTFNDYYGYLTSCSKNPAEMDAYAREYGITQKSTLELRLVTRVYQKPVVETPENIAQHHSCKPGWAREFGPIPSEWRLRMPVPEGEEYPGSEGFIYPSLDEVAVMEELTWSSKLTTEENEAMLAEFLQRAAASDIGNLEFNDE